MDLPAEEINIGFVLSGGGLRGAAHLGILRRLLGAGIRIDNLVGVSAGAVVAAFYAAVGLSVEEMIVDARFVRGRHLILHGLALRVPPRIRPLVHRFCGILPGRLEQLERASFDRLNHGVRALGIVCHDIITNQPAYFASGRRNGVTLAKAVRASASLPVLIPTRSIRRGERRYHLVDGGLSDPLPVTFARSDGLGSTHLVVCDCRSAATAVPNGDNVVYVRPHIRGTGVLRSPRSTLLGAVRSGESAVTREMIEKIQGWCAPHHT